MDCEAFKYTGPMYAESCRRGEVYLSSFEAIRTLDNEGIGDPNEGSSTKSGNLAVDANAQDWQTRRQVEDLARYGVNLRSGKLRAQNSTFRQVLPDALMYCATLKQNDEFWRTAYGYEPALHIFKFDKFIRKICHALERCHVGFNFVECLVDRCTYEDPVLLGDPTPLPPSYFRKTRHKHIEYDVQDEIRAVFKFDNGNVRLGSGFTVQLDFDDGNVWAL